MKFDEQALAILEHQPQKQVNAFIADFENKRHKPQISDDEIEKTVSKFREDNIARINHEIAEWDVPSELKDAWLKSLDESVERFRSELREESIAYDFYKPSTSEQIKGYKKALKHLRSLDELLKQGLGFMNPYELRNAITITELELWFNEQLNTGGKPSSLSRLDVMNLSTLKESFQIYFQNLSHRFVKGNLLYQLGVSLVGKNLPDNVNNLIDKQLFTESPKVSYPIKTPPPCK